MAVVRQFDVLVIGSGVAGLYAATRCAQQGLNVAVLDKGLAGRSSASYSAKGFAAIGPWSVNEDSEEQHVNDTLKSGRHVNDPRLVEAMVKHAAGAIAGLESMGMLFDRKSDGVNLALHGKAAGHSWPRDIGFSDITGKQLVDTLLSQVRMLGVSVLSDHVAIDIALGANGVMGCFVLDIDAGEVVAIEASVVVMATGGIGDLYPLTSNSVQNTGDGIAIAMRAGATVKDMEFVQFYPATVIYPSVLRGVNTNSIGLGAQLLNSAKERFMSRLEPEKLEQVTRDRLSQCIYLEIMAGRGSENGGVYLDATSIPREKYKAAFPSEWRLAEHAGLDLGRDVIEVAPGAHYFMGGIEISPDGSTDVPGLLALGECTSGVHGANRLANNSLTEALSFGMIGGDCAAALARQRSPGRIGVQEVSDVDERIRRHVGAPASGAAVAGSMKQQVKDIMGQFAGVVRDAHGLATGERLMNELSRTASEATVSGGMVWNPELLRVLEVQNMTLVGAAIIKSAGLRKESRGSQYRTDFPDEDSAWQRNIRMRYLQDSGEIMAEAGTVEPAEGAKKHE
jgi:fumarate reductase (CoM/CoB) subunit A